MSYSTADLCDRNGDDVRVADSVFKDYGGRRHFHGQIYALRVFEDFMLVKHVLSEPGDGRVLVVDGDGYRRGALLGDRLAALGVAGGWAGVIVNGYIRDSEEIGRLDIGVKALGTIPVRSGSTGKGERGVDAVFAGTMFKTGAYVYADPDGVIVSDTDCG